MFRVAVDRFCSRRPPPSPLGPPHSPYDGILVESALNFSQFVVQRIKNPNSNVGRTDADADVDQTPDDCFVPMWELPSLGISTESLSHSQDVGGCLHKPEKKMSHTFPSNNDLKSIDHPQCFISILR